MLNLNENVIAAIRNHALAGDFTSSVLVNLIDSVGVNIKLPCRVAAAVDDVTSPGATLSGIDMVVGDRFLNILNMGAGGDVTNGIWIWRGATTPATRAPDADTSIKFKDGGVVVILEGTFASHLFLTTTDNPFIVGTDPIDFLHLSTGNTVVWAPYNPPPTGDYVVNWAEAVAAVNSMTGSTFIEIYADPENDTVIIPGGTWDLNNTTIVGKSVGADRDSNSYPYRGWQELLYVVGEGDNTNPLWLRGCVGMKDLFFRPTDFSWGYCAHGFTASITAFNCVTKLATVTTTDGPDFNARDVGKPIRLGDVTPWQSGNPADSGGNNGTFIIKEVVDANTIKIYNRNAVANDSNNGSIEWDKCMSPFIITESVFREEYQPPQEDDYSSAPASFQTNFILDNVDFRYDGHYRWGAMFVLENNQEKELDPGVFVHLVNGASVRWWSMSIDGYLAIQSDGSAAWIGYHALAGGGYADIFAQAGLQFRTGQVIDDYTIYQPNVIYVPDNDSNWDSTPENVWSGLDQLADRVTTTEGLAGPYSPADGGNWNSPPSTVAAGLDELASRVKTIENTFPLTVSKQYHFENVAAKSATDVHTAFRGDLTTVDPDPVDGVTINNPAIPRNLRVTMGAHWDGGDVIVYGTNQFDESISETFLAGTTAVRVGVNAFKTITSITKTIAGSDADGTNTASVGTGDALGIADQLEGVYGDGHLIGTGFDAPTLDTTYNTVVFASTPDNSKDWNLTTNIVVSL